MSSNIKQYASSQPPVTTPRRRTPPAAVQVGGVTSPTAPIGKQLKTCYPTTSSNVTTTPTAGGRGGAGAEPYRRPNIEYRREKKGSTSAPTTTTTATGGTSSGDAVDTLSNSSSSSEASSTSTAPHLRRSSSGSTASSSPSTIRRVVASSARRTSWRVTHTCNNCAHVADSPTSFPSPNVLRARSMKTSFASLVRQEVQRVAQREQVMLEREEQLAALEQRCTAEGLSKQDRTVMAMMLVDEARRFQHRQQQQQATSTTNVGVSQGKKKKEAGAYPSSDGHVVVEDLPLEVQTVIHQRRSSTSQRNYNLLCTPAYKAIIEDVRILMSREVPPPKQKPQVEIDELAKSLPSAYKPPADNFGHIKRELSALNLWTTFAHRRTTALHKKRVSTTTSTGRQNYSKSSSSSSRQTK